jgi:hypothetical protein
LQRNGACVKRIYTNCRKDHLTALVIILTIFMEQSGSMNVFIFERILIVFNTAGNLIRKFAVNIYAKSILVTRQSLGTEIANSIMGEDYPQKVICN